MQSLILRLLRRLEMFLKSHRTTKSLLRFILQVRNVLLKWLAWRKPFCHSRALGTIRESNEHQLVFRPATRSNEIVSPADICTSRAPERNSYGEFLTAFPLFPPQPTGHSLSTSDLHSASLRPSFLRQNASVQNIDNTQREHFHLRNVSTPNLQAQTHVLRPRTFSRLSRRTLSPDPNRSTITLSLVSNVGSARSAYLRSLLTATTQHGARSVVDRAHPLEMRRHSPVSSILVIGPDDPDPGGDWGYDRTPGLAEHHSQNHSLREIADSADIPSPSPEPEPRLSSLTMTMDPALPVGGLRRHPRHLKI